LETAPSNHDTTNIDQDSTPEQRKRNTNEPETDVPDVPSSDDETQRLLDPVKTNDRAA